jgi:RNA polymerase sigma factor (sigma-70 family)
MTRVHHRSPYLNAPVPRKSCKCHLGLILLRVGWASSDLALRTGINISVVDNIVSLSRRPTSEEANAIQIALGEAGEYWDALELRSCYLCNRKMKDRKRLHGPHIVSLNDHPEVLQIPSPEAEVSKIEQAFEMAMSRLPYRTREVLIRRFWKNESYRQIGLELGVTRSRVYQMELCGLEILSRQILFGSLVAFIPHALRTGLSNVTIDPKNFFPVNKPEFSEKIEVNE